jgi:serine/threonine protein kinase
MNPERWRQLEDIYHAAMGRAAMERAAFLDEVCAGDEALRRDVEALLAAHDQLDGEAADFLNSPALEIEARAIATAIESPIHREQLGHYRILSRIGAGGMGEVWLARDTRLDRRVALKLLPSQFTQEAERLQRFVREAKAASALNHPNIITIHEIGEIGAVRFIATEFIEGVTLRRRMADERLELGEALGIAVQIAAALDAAHRAGIIHRDIKPENVMVRPDGLVKVLDFGLAKLIAPPSEQPGVVDTNAPTMAQEMRTTPGIILGTLQYMSPEQARGRDVDARSDIFSLGVVIYEMITGERLFAGDATADIIAAIIHKTPEPLSQFTPESTSELERIVRKALAKDRQSRYQTARDLQIDLQSVKQELDLSRRSGHSGSISDRSDGRSGEKSGDGTIEKALRSGSQTFFRGARRAGWFLAAGALILMTLIVAGAVWLFPKSSRVPSNLRFETLYGKKGQDSVYLVQQSRFSPDGRMIAFSAPGDGENIYTRQISGERRNQVTFDRWQDGSPLWSQDGERIAFVSNRGNQIGVWVIPSTGGTPELVKKLADREAANTSSGRHRLVAWTEEGKAIYYEWNEGLFRLDLVSKAITRAAQFDPVSGATGPLRLARDYSISVDGRDVAFSAQTGDAETGGQFDIWRVSIRGGTPRRVTNDPAPDTRPIWRRDGKLFYNSQRDGARRLYLVDSSGGESELIPTGDHQLTLHDYSPANGRLLGYEYRDESDIFSLSLESGVEMQVTDDLGAEFWSAVSPNGATILYQAIRGERFAWAPRKSLLMTKSLAGKGQPTRLAVDAFEAQWSPNGEQIGFLRMAGATPNLWIINAAGGEEHQMVPEGIQRNSYRSSPPFNLVYPKVWSWSFDSRQIAYCGIQDGVANVWTASAEGARTTRVTSNQNRAVQFDSPAWSPNGERLAFVSDSGDNSGAGKVTRGLWVTDGETPKMIFQTDAALQFLGWSGNETCIAAVAEEFSVQPTTVKLLSLTAPRTGAGAKNGSASNWLGELSDTFWVNLHLSSNGRNLAYVRAPEGRNDIWTVPVSDSRLGVARKLTNNGDPSFFFSSLAWAPDGKTIYYDKQTRWYLLTMIESLK